MKSRTKGVIAAVVILAVLAAAFWYGGGAPGLQGWAAAPAETETVSPAASPSPLPQETAGPETETPAPGGAEETETPAPAPAGTEDPEPEETQTPSTDAETSPSPGLPPETSGTAETPAPSPAEGGLCTLTIRCDTALDHPDWLSDAAAAAVPADGVILAETEAAFEAGETVFDVLLRLTREEGIHLEYSVTPLYGSVYIEGIGNLYEFDCGQSSGWVYAVNGEFPGYSCSEHALTDGDRVLFAYTCQQGDVQALAEELP